MTRTRLAPLALGAALALVLTACGDEESPAAQASALPASTSAEGGTSTATASWSPSWRR